MNSGSGRRFRLLHAFRHHHAADRAALAVFAQGGSFKIPADDAIGVLHGRFAHQHGPSGQFLREGVQPVRVLLRIGGQHVVLDDAFGLVEPERRDAAQHRALVRDQLVEHHVERGDAVGDDHEDGIPQVCTSPGLCLWPSGDGRETDVSFMSRVIVFPPCRGLPR